MNHIVTRETEDSATVAGSATYAERRAAMADETRTRILDACVEILAQGPDELTIPAVAKAAGVSVPTVYRNFPDKKALVHETALYLRDKRRPLGPPDTLDELPQHLLRTFEDAAGIAETVRAALISQPMLQARRELGEHEIRKQHSVKLFGSALDALSPQDRERAVVMATVLCSTATLRAFREVVGAGPEVAADVVAWTINRILGRSFSSDADTNPSSSTAKSTPKRRTKGKRS